jgi:uncharacterized protein YndB with AHSA1/START domain
MAITFQHAVDVNRAPEEVFAILDDTARTPEWLERCTGLESLSEGPNVVGTKLRYAYREGGRSGTMDGQVTAREAGEHLAMRYDDKMMGVDVDFRVSPSGAGSRLQHTITVSPKTLGATLFSPLIRRQLPKQTIGAMEKLKALAEREAG